MVINSEMWEGRYDHWKLESRDDGLERDRRRTGRGGKYGTVEYEYMVEKLGKCPCCDEDILEDDMWTEDKDGIMLHFQCLNYKIKAEEEEKRDGK
jgi:hypothetical protein